MLPNKMDIRPLTLSGVQEKDSIMRKEGAAARAFDLATQTSEATALSNSTQLYLSNMMILKECAQFYG